MVDAVARAAGVPVARRAARAHARGRPRRGRDGRARRRAGGARRGSGSRSCGRCSRCSRRPPRRPGEALERVGAAAVEWKLDGARIQVHRRGDEVRVFTRNLADVTDRVPEVVEAVLALPVDAVVLDGEAIALRPDGRPRAVPGDDEPLREQDARAARDRRSRRSSSTASTSTARTCSTVPLAERRAALVASVPESMRVPRRSRPTDAEEAERFLEDALAHGHEGVMVKALDAPYEAGRRGAGWLKVKPVHTLDLVVLAAEWGTGGARGGCRNLHLGARDPETGGFVMLGKTFKGMTDEMLAWQTERLLELEAGRDGHVVHVRPELVVEIAFDGVQASSRYPGGVALRFARVKGYRPDKPAAEADTIDHVRALHVSA